MPIRRVHKRARVLTTEPQDPIALLLFSLRSRYVRSGYNYQPVQVY